MVPDAEIRTGIVVKIKNWHGVVLETHRDEAGNLSVIQVQTVRNLFRGFGPEFIDLRLNREAIEVATLDDLQHEVTTHRRLLEGAVARLLTAVQETPPISIAAD